MRRLLTRGLSARKTRSLLTGLAVVLGVGLVSGTYILTDTIEKAFDSILRTPYRGTSAVVTVRHDHSRPGADRGILSDRLLATIASLPEVREARGTLLDLSRGGAPVSLLDSSGEPIEDGPTFAFGIDPDAERFNPLELVDGRWAAADGEVVIDVETAERYGYDVLDAVGFLGREHEEGFTIVGLARFEGVSTLGGATVALFDVETAQRVLQTDDFHAIAVAAAEDVKDQQLLGSIRSVLPPRAEVRTGAQQAAAEAEAATSVRSVRAFLLAFGAIALLVAAFVIGNSFSITIAQRTRELATLRLLGASRRQIRRSVLAEAAVIGGLASFAGIALGFLLAEGLTAFFRLLDLQMPEMGTVVRPRTLIVPIAAGLAVTVLAARGPARDATRVAPLAAVRESELAAPPRRVRRDVAGALLLAAAGALAIVSMFAPREAVQGRVRAVVVAGVLSFIAMTLLAPKLMRPLGALIGRPLEWIGGTASRLARQNTMRNPRRTASTAAAVALGLALSTLGAVVGEAVLSSGEQAVQDQIRTARIVDSPNGWQRPPVDLGRALDAAPGISEAASIRTAGGGLLLRDGRSVDVSGVDTATIAELYRFTWEEGADRAVPGLGPDGALVAHDLAETQRVTVGDAIETRTWDGQRVRAVIRGIFVASSSHSLLGDVVIPEARFADLFPPATPALILVRARDGEAVEAALRRFPDAEVVTARQVAEARNPELVIALRVLVVLLVLAILVSLTGMVNTMILSIVERRRELGLLRAVGMSRRQVRRMVRHEAILTAVLGAALGIPLGMLVAAGVVDAMDAQAIRFSVPVGALAGLTLLTLLLGLASSVLPSRWASRRAVIDVFRRD